MGFAPLTIVPSVSEEVGGPVPRPVGCSATSWVWAVGPVGVAEAMLGGGATAWEPPVGVAEAVSGCAAEGLLQKKSSELLRLIAMASAKEKVNIGGVAPSLV